MHQVRNRLLVCLGCCTVMRSERSQPTRNVAANQPKGFLVLLPGVPDVSEHGYQGGVPKPNGRTAWRHWHRGPRLT